MKPELSVVIPTLNERDNIVPLLAGLERVLDGIAWEAMFVDDDSTDGTLQVLERVSEERSNVRFIRRVGRRGLSSAVVEGMLATTAPYLAVMDADLQHDETVIPRMLKVVKDENLDIASASRFQSGSELDGLSEGREHLSRAGIALCGLVMKAELTDPLTGCFLLRRALINEVVDKLSLKGFKILLDIHASADRELRHKELAMHFRQRHAGESKLDTLVSLEFVTVVADKLLGGWIPVRFIAFVLVGTLGMIVHIGVLALGYKTLGVGFMFAQTLATYTAMTVNYFVNNYFTYRDRRLRGWELLTGFASFAIICSIGAVVNVQIAEFLFGLRVPWLLAGLLGAIVGSVWNYAVSSTLTWRPRKRGK